MVLATALLLRFQQISEPDVTTNPFNTAEDIGMGKKSYGGRCAGCHGPADDGGKGANLATPVLPRGQDDVALYRTIRFGIPESEMPAIT
jgi:mono/diheme cytochrome c family protein